jgi:hypothetical protein
MKRIVEKDFIGISCQANDADSMEIAAAVSTPKTRTV